MENNSDDLDNINLNSVLIEKLNKTVLNDLLKKIVIKTGIVQIEQFDASNALNSININKKLKTVNLQDHQISASLTKEQINQMSLFGIDAINKAKSTLIDESIQQIIKNYIKEIKTNNVVVYNLNTFKFILNKIRLFFNNFLNTSYKDYSIYKKINYSIESANIIISDILKIIYNDSNKQSFHNIVVITNSNITSILKQSSKFEIFINHTNTNTLYKTGKIKNILFLCDPLMTNDDNEVKIVYYSEDDVLIMHNKQYFYVTEDLNRTLLKLNNRYAISISEDTKQKNKSLFYDIK